MTHLFRVFPNVNNLHRLVILLRLRTTDPLSEAFTYLRLFDDPLHYEEYVAVQSILEDAQITALLSSPTTPDEQNRLDDYFNSAADFNALPGWATWTAAEAEANITNLIFAGKTLEQVEADVDALANSFPAMKNGLKSAASQIITTRNILVNIAKAIVFFRNLVVRLRSG